MSLEWLYILSSFPLLIVTTVLIFPIAFTTVLIFPIAIVFVFYLDLSSVISLNMYSALGCSLIVLLRSISW